MAAVLTEGEDDEITRLRERIGEVIGARGLAILSEAARYADAFTGEGQQPPLPSRNDMCERCGLHPTCGMSVSYNGSWPPTHLCRPCYDAEFQPQQPPTRAQAAALMTQPPFTGEGHRLGDE